MKELSQMNYNFSYFALFQSLYEEKNSSITIEFKSNVLKSLSNI